MNFYNLSPDPVLKKKIMDRISAIIDRQDFIKGKEVEQLELELCKYTGAAHCVTCANGTDALTIALLAARIGPGDAVITTPFSFVATTEAIVRAGMKPIFCDISGATFNLDPHMLRRTLANAPQESRPKAIVATDLFGLPADWTEINAIAKAYGLITIADAAQSFGGSIGSRKVGTLADITCTSFFPTKPLGCYGDGGAIFTNNHEYATKARAVGVHGSYGKKYHHEIVGMNSRLDTIQAAILLEKLPLIDNEIHARRLIVRHYLSTFSGSTCFPQSQLPPETASSYSSFAFLARDRQMIIAALEQQGIPTSIYYPMPIHRMPPYQKYATNKNDLQIAEAVSNCIVSIPIMHRPSFSIHQKILQTLNQCIGQKTS